MSIFFMCYFCNSQSRILIIDGPMIDIYISHIYYIKIKQELVHANLPFRPFCYGSILTP